MMRPDDAQRYLPEPIGVGQVYLRHGAESVLRGAMHITPTGVLFYDGSLLFIPHTNINMLEIERWLGPLKYRVGEDGWPEVDDHDRLHKVLDEAIAKHDRYSDALRYIWDRYSAGDLTLEETIHATYALAFHQGRVKEIEKYSRFIARLIEVGRSLDVDMVQVVETTIRLLKDEGVLVEVVPVVKGNEGGGDR